MQEAYLVISESEKKLVRAEDVEHRDYRRIFQCPECKATLKLMEGYFRSGHWVRPTFQHPKGDEKDCKHRISFDTSPSPRSRVFDKITRGQSSKKLEKAFIDCLVAHKIKRHSSILDPYSDGVVVFFSRVDLEFKDQIEHNKRPEIICPEPSALIESGISILESRRSGKFIREQLNAIELGLRDREDIINHFRGRIKRKKISDDLVKSLIRKHFEEALLILNFVRWSSSRDLREKFIEINVFGNSLIEMSNRSLLLSGLSNSSDILKAENQVGILVPELPLSEVIRIGNDPKFLDYLFNDLYTDNNSQITNFLRFVLLLSLESVYLYDWSWLPMYYR